MIDYMHLIVCECGADSFTTAGLLLTPAPGASCAFVNGFIPTGSVCSVTCDQMLDVIYSNNAGCTNQATTTCNADFTWSNAATAYTCVPRFMSNECGCYRMSGNITNDISIHRIFRILVPSKSSLEALLNRSVLPVCGAMQLPLTIACQDL